MQQRSYLVNELEIFEMLSKNIDAGRKVIMVYIDFHTAFGMFLTGRRLQTVKEHGIQGVLANGPKWGW